MQPVAEQITVFIMLVILGLAIGLIYDFYRVLRRVHGLKKKGTNIGDAFFWLVVTVCTYIFLLKILWGEVRFYVFISMAIGFILYIKVGSPFIFRKLFYLYNFIIKMIKTTIRLVVIPFKILYNLIAIPVRFSAGVLNSALDAGAKTQKHLQGQVKKQVQTRVEKVKKRFKKPPQDPPSL
ncbi:MAG: spore cortex biosynthesis protein YabQ [Clostridia bacterium]|nr:spore cortex biosynthesis protein YabQ [Clostridia bacterium]